MSGTKGLAQKDMTLQGLNFTFKTVPVYEWNPLDNVVKLDFSYAKPEIRNTQDWNTDARQDKIPYEIDLVYTRYPVDSLKWLTPYDKLLNERVKFLLNLDPALKTANIKWNLVAQTACTTAVLAETFFHGWAIKYTVPENPTQEYYDLEGNIDYKKRSEFYISHVKQVINGKAQPADTTVLRLLERMTARADAKKLLVVMDWTSSMYIHGAQVLRWNQQHLAQNRLKYLVLFNDGDDFLRKNVRKPLGEAGGIYFTQPQNLDEVIQTMQNVIQNGDGGDIPENACEALLKAIQKYPDADQVILIADALADIRDLALADKITKPVHVILCGSRKRYPSPDYLTLVWKTGGTIANMEAELTFNGNKDPRYRHALKLGVRHYIFDQALGKFKYRRD
jgi:hypothetical protein